MRAAATTAPRTETVPRRRWLLATAVAAPLFLLACTVAVGGLATTRPWGDVGNYERYGRQLLDGLIPYHDFYMEYPPGALPVFVAPAILTDTGTEYLLVFKGLMALLGVAALAAVARILDDVGADRRRLALALAFVVLSPVLLGHVFLNRYDLWPATLVVLALAALVAGRERSGFALLAGGFAAKIFAVAALPAAVLRVWRTGGARPLVRALAVAAAVTFAIFIVFVVVAFGGIGFSYYTNVTRSLQAETLAASLIFAADQLGLYGAETISGSPGSIDLGGRVADASSVLSSLVALAGIAAAAWLYRRGPETRERLVAAFAASVASFTVFAKVLSPQFLVWLVPLVPLVAGRSGLAATGLLAAALVATQVELQGWVGMEIAGWAVWVLLLRNVLLVALFGVLLSALRQRA